MKHLAFNPLVQHDLRDLVQSRFHLLSFDLNCLDQVQGFTRYENRFSTPPSHGLNLLTTVLLLALVLVFRRIQWESPPVTLQVKPTSPRSMTTLPSRRISRRSHHRRRQNSRWSTGDRPWKREVSPCRISSGLPGEGWDSTRKHEVEGSRTGDQVTFQGEEFTGTLSATGITVMNSDGNKIGELKKVIRKSPTLGTQPPEGAVVLFDEKGTNRFPGGKLSPEGWLMQGATSEPTFDDFSLHLEFMLSYAPDKLGQGRSNSGLYLQGRYEVQILDSFGLEGKDNEAAYIPSVLRGQHVLPASAMADL
ncbi:family 16 glycoside hydrolase [Planctopirus ephydatiae]|uniref:family 16 glycoside hydrolase n=1 Tax=Planctopirus ephydatiae TaxID=2528019 RepID=UPI001C98D970|nr:family 16 glycoside hydrolase [Planctopirus ephydatiae]